MNYTDGDLRTWSRRARRWTGFGSATYVTIGEGGGAGGSRDKEIDEEIAVERNERPEAWATTPVTERDIKWVEDCLMERGYSANRTYLRRMTSDGEAPADNERLHFREYVDDWLLYLHAAHLLWLVTAS